MIQRNDLLPQLLEKFKTVGAEDEPVKLFGIRNPKLMGTDIFGNDTQTAGAGDDLLGICIDNQNVFLSVGSTRPGLHAYVVHPEGAAYVATGFHSKIWAIDTHAADNPSFAHEALCERPAMGCLPIAFWRDAKKTYKQGDYKIERSADCGFNMHRCNVSADATTISVFSEGCMIRNSHFEHEQMMDMIKALPVVDATKYTDNKGKVRYKYLFSYLLTETPDWKGL